MMKKRQLSLLLALAFCFTLSACSVAAAGDTGTGAEPSPQADPSAPAEPLDPNRAYRLEKLNEVNDMILARETVPADYFRYLDEALTPVLEDYNAQTRAMRIVYTERATHIAKSFFYEHQPDPGDYAHSDMYYEWVARISHYAMYENARELCENDPYLSYNLSKEAGGSGGLWAWRLHESVSPEVQEQTQAYFTMIDQLLTLLDEARQAFA